MERPIHDLAELFAQLGLPNDEASMRAFIEQHAPLPADVALADAPWWTPAQARFLHDAKCEDADWAEVVDQLDAALRR
ncbi:DUF2789 domain-containing protein [Tepidimonas aquatica]|uniref:DUF2789 domain-containing protein n=1 Tax=Tepidimonas aquatica TaxID=247482 RepID=A0A554WMJ4_9BURK|nr:DUF2789 domain-containing protein [Tepidimonas aquatica]TSE24797.1 hypothetical protein Taqua_01363 [Tepidimonas aquatica]